MRTVRTLLVRATLTAGLVALAVGMMVVAPREALAADQCPNDYAADGSFKGCLCPGRECRFANGAISQCGLSENGSRFHNGG